MEVQDNRFKSLIDPIRDLAANWDIDIADSLNIYLDELSDLKISFDNGNTNVNFAEAALLIQGSTAIYSKKVEYLHQLVMKALEYISNQKSLPNANQEDKSGSRKSSKAINMSIADDERLQFGSDPTYLLLDDVVEEAHDIDLADEDINVKLHDRRSMRSSISGDFSRNSTLIVNSILHEDQGGTNLKMSSCHMDISGALLIGGFSNNQNELNVSHHNNSMSVIKSNYLNEQNYPADADDGNDNEYGGNGFEYNADLSVNAEDPVGNFIRSNLQLEKRPTITTQKPATTTRAKKTPVYGFLDPHEVTKDSKAVKKGCCFRVPKHNSSQNSLTEELENYLTSQIKKTNKYNIPLDSKIPLTGFLTTTFSDLAKKNQQIVRKNRLVEYTAEIVEEEDFIYRDASEDNVILSTRKLNKQLMYNNIDNDNQELRNDAWDDFDDDNGAEEYNNAPMMQEGVENLINEEEITNSKQLPFDEDEDLASRVEKIFDDNADEFQGAASYEMLCRKHIENFMKGAEKYAKETNLSRRVSDWTSRLEPLLQQQEQAPAFDIHQYSDQVLVKVGHISRVNKKTSVAEKSNGNIEFNEIVSGKDTGEVCRVFLACLQLAAAGNIHVIPPEQLQNSAKTSKQNKYKTIQECQPEYSKSFSLKLLSSSRNVDVENFLAPSIVSGNLIESSV